MLQQVLYFELVSVTPHGDSMNGKLCMMNDCQFLLDVLMMEMESYIRLCAKSDD